MYKAVIVGCGAMSRHWLRAVTANPDLVNQIEIVGLVDLDVTQAKRIASKSGLGDVVVGCNLNEALARLKPDLLFDVVAPSARREIVATGLRHGCHVLSEKPMAMAMSDARDLLKLACDANRVHAIVQNRRYVDGVRRMRQLVESGETGDITAVHCDFFIGAHFGGFREKMEHVLLLDMAIHTFDAARFVIGASPCAVYCQETNPVGSWFAHGAAANAIFEFEGGVTATYRGSWCAEGANTSWESNWRVIGTRGTLMWDGADGFEAHVVASNNGLLRDTAPIQVPKSANPAKTQGHASVIRDFLDSISTGRPPETAGSDNLKSLTMVFGAIESAKTRTRIELETE